MKIRVERSRRGLLFRLWNRKWAEIAWLNVAISGLGFVVEIPSDWHEHRRAWIRIGLGVCRLAFSFPWLWSVPPDEHQCAGPTYGFQFFADLFWIYYGKPKGTREDPRIAIYMPWHWRHYRHEVLGDREKHPYVYLLRNRELQHRTATIYPEERRWWRPWPPFRMVRKSINVDFSDEVGERTGSWKGGTTGCGYDMRRGERPLDTLRRMERERVFN